MPLDGVAAAKVASQGPLFARANVVGVAIGTKRIHEQDTRERCLTDFVPIHFNERSVGPVGRLLQRAVGPILGVLGLSLKRLPKGRMNLVDAAVAEPIDTNLISPDILDIGRVTESAEATIGATVRKSGRTTGLTEGHVTAIDAVVEVDYGGGKTAMFRGQIVSDLHSKGGDSGS